MTQSLLSIVANFETTLADGITPTATSLALGSATTQDGSTIPSGTYGFTINEGKANEEHVIGSVSGTAVTSLLRGVSVEDATTEVAGLKQKHRKGVSIKITNHPSIMRMLRILNGTTALDASTPLKYDGDPSISADAELATVKFVNDTAIAGAPDASTTTKGISKLSSAPASATDPIAVGDNDPRVPTTDDVAAMAGTSGTPSSTNKYVTNDDVTEAKTASKVVRRDSNGDALVATTPTAGDAATSKTYVDSNPAANKNGYGTRNISLDTDLVIAHGLGRIPKKITIDFLVVSMNGGGVVTSHGVFDGTSSRSLSIVEAGSSGWNPSQTAINAKIAYIQPKSGMNNQATIVVDATNITISWSKTSTPTGTASYTWEAE